MPTVTLPFFPNQLSMRDIVKAHIEAEDYYLDNNLSYLGVGMSNLYAGSTAIIYNLDPAPYVAAGTIAYKGGSYSVIPSSGQISIGDFHGSTGQPRYRYSSSLSSINTTDYTYTPIPNNFPAYVPGKTTYTLTFGYRANLLSPPNKFISRATSTSTAALTIDLSNFNSGDIVNLYFYYGAVLGKGGAGGGGSGGTGLRIIGKNGLGVTIVVGSASEFLLAGGGGGGGGTYGGGGAGGGNGGGPQGGAGATTIDTSGNNGGNAAGGGGGGLITTPWYPVNGFPQMSPGGGTFAPIGGMYGTAGATHAGGNGGQGGSGGGGGGWYATWRSPAPTSSLRYYALTGVGSWSGYGGGVSGTYDVYDAYGGSGILSGNWGGGGGGWGSYGGMAGAGLGGAAISSTHPYNVFRNYGGLFGPY